jgi:hypothetical protein
MPRIKGVGCAHVGGGARDHRGRPGGRARGRGREATYRSCVVTSSRRRTGGGHGTRGLTVHTRSSRCSTALERSCEEDGGADRWWHEETAKGVRVRVSIPPHGNPPSPVPNPSPVAWRSLLQAAPARHPAALQCARASHTTPTPLAGRPGAPGAWVPLTRTARLAIPKELAVTRSRVRAGAKHLSVRLRDGPAFLAASHSILQGKHGIPRALHPASTHIRKRRFPRGGERGTVQEAAHASSQPLRSGAAGAGANELVANLHGARGKGGGRAWGHTNAREQGSMTLNQGARRDNARGHREASNLRKSNHTAAAARARAREQWPVGEWGVGCVCTRARGRTWSPWAHVMVHSGRLHTRSTRASSQLSSWLEPARRGQNTGSPCPPPSTRGGGYSKRKQVSSLPPMAHACAREGARGSSPVCGPGRKGRHRTPRTVQGEVGGGAALHQVRLLARLLADAGGRRGRGGTHAHTPQSNQGTACTGRPAAARS